MIEQLGLAGTREGILNMHILLLEMSSKSPHITENSCSRHACSLPACLPARPILSVCVSVVPPSRSLSLSVFYGGGLFSLIVQFSSNLLLLPNPDYAARAPSLGTARMNERPSGRPAGRTNDTPPRAAGRKSGRGRSRRSDGSADAPLFQKVGRFLTF